MLVFTVNSYTALLPEIGVFQNFGLLTLPQLLSLCSNVTPTPLEASLFITLPCFLLCTHGYFAYAIVHQNVGARICLPSSSRMSVRVSVSSRLESSTEGNCINKPHSGWRKPTRHGGGPRKCHPHPLAWRGRRRELCLPKAESCAKEEELPTTPMLRQGGSGKQGKLSNFFLLPPSDFLPVFPTGSQRAWEPGWCSPWLSGSWGTAQSSKECGMELDENGPTITSPVLVRGWGSTLVEWVNEWMNKENRRERDSKRICFNNFPLWARHPI